MSNLLNYYKNKKILITGHTGFKGSWLSNVLYLAGAKVIGISKIQKNPKHIFNSSKINKKIKSYYIDIRNLNGLKKIVSKEKPDFIFHFAAQSLVPHSIKYPTETWTVNLFGTLNIIDVCKDLINSKLILITSDKCYKNNEWIWGYRENDELGGDDPYSASKAACELLIHSQKKILSDANYKLKIVSARAGNVIGGGDWSEGRIIPDCFRAWQNNKRVSIRNIYSTRPWQYVIEPLIGYLKLGKFISYKKNDENSFNFGPDMSNDYSVKDLLEQISLSYPKAKWKQINKKNIVESSLLKLNSEKAKKLLHWRCLLNFEETVKLTSDWYISQQNGLNMEKLTINQIESYISKLNI